MRQHQNSAILMLSKAYFYGYCQSADIVLAMIFIQLSQLEQFCSRKFTKKCIFPLFRRSFSCVMNYPVMIYRIWWDTFGELTKDNQSAAQRSPLYEWTAELFQIFYAKSLASSLKTLQMQNKSCSKVSFIWHCSREFDFTFFSQLRLLACRP